MHSPTVNIPGYQSATLIQQLDPNVLIATTLIVLVLVYKTINDRASGLAGSFLLLPVGTDGQRYIDFYFGPVPPTTHIRKHGPTITNAHQQLTNGGKSTGVIHPLTWKRLPLNQYAVTFPDIGELQIA